MAAGGHGGRAGVTRLLVIGGDAAGMSAASKAKRVDPALEVVALEATEWVSYSACGLPYLVAGDVPTAGRLVARTVEQFRQQGIEVKSRHRALRVDVEDGVVYALDEQAGHEVQEPFDRLVIGTGARPRWPAVLGADLPGVFPLRTLGDGPEMRAWCSRPGVRQAVIVGAGYVGVEMAETFRALGLETTVLQRSRQVLADLDAEMAAPVHAELERQRVRLLFGTGVDHYQGTAEGVKRVVLVDGGTIDADVVLVAVGVEPAVDVAQTAGVALGASGAIAVDEQQRTNVTHVYAAGDCAEAYHRVLRKPAWVPLGTTANKQGRIAGENAAGGHARFPGMVGTSITRVCELEIATTGLSLKQAQAAGLNAVAVTIRSTDIAGYMPGAHELRVRLVGEAHTGRLLGGQLVGGGGVKRIDTVATALHAEMTAEQVGWLDLAYAPPFSSVWDPVLVAAQELQKAL